MTSLFPRIRLPLRILVPLVVGIGGSLVLIFGTLQHWRGAMREVEETARREAAEDMTDLQGAISYLLRQRDTTGVQTVLSNQASHGSLKDLLLVDDHEQILAATRLALIGRPLASTVPELAVALRACAGNRWAGKSELSAERRSLFSCYPVMLPLSDRSYKVPIGYLLARNDLSWFKATAARRVFTGAVHLALLLGAGFLAVMLLLGRFLAGRRIARVVNTTERLAGGELDARVGLQGVDELATIGEAVDRMADRLEMTTQALQQARDELEDRVQARTAELEKVNATLKREIIVRLQAEEAARREQAWLRSLIETTQDAVLAIDRRGLIVLFNPAAEKTFGYRQEEIVGRKADIIIAEPYASEHDARIARRGQTGKIQGIGRTITGTARRKNGELFPVELSVTEIPSDENVQYAAFIRDVSEKIGLQEQLVENERLAVIGSTAAKIGHEIANPINGMYLTVQLLEQRLAANPSASNGQIASSVRKIKDEIARLNQLVQQFRDISRKEKYDFRPVNLVELIDRVTEIQRPLCTGLGIEIESELESGLPIIMIDADKITQAILNLYKNAVEAMPHGGKVTVRASVSRDRIVIAVSDTGVGIPPEMNIFEPFATTKKQGTGIGLVVVRQIVTTHGGTITYHSEPGRGTTFVLSLPKNRHID